MCIYTNDDKCKIAKQDISCMKVVRKYTDNQGKTVYTSLYNFVEPVEYTIGKVTRMNDCIRKYKNVPEYIKVMNKHILHEYNPERFDKLRNCVEAGLHSFGMNAKGCKDVGEWAVTECAEYYKHHPSDDNICLPKDDLCIALLKCVIPAGTKYVEGVHNCFSRNVDDIYDEIGYCSEAIKVIEELKIY